VLPPPWPNFLWMFVCIWVKFWFHHFTSASNHWFQHYATQEKPDVLNWFVENATRFKLCHTKSL
jgi:hypothetical protein